MKIILDSNILISALIKNSTTRKIIMESDLRFYYPILAMQEIEKYKSLILEKSELSDMNYNEIFSAILNYVTLVPQEIITPFVQKANEIIGNVDKKDVIFIALALAISNNGIWSEDKDFKKQDKIKIWTTKDIMKLTE